MKKNNKTKLIISGVSFAISFTLSLILGLKLMEGVDALPAKEEDYLSNF